MKRREQESPFPYRPEKLSHKGEGEGSKVSWTPYVGLSWLPMWIFLLNIFAVSIGETTINMNINQNRLQVSWLPISLNLGSNSENFINAKKVLSLGQTVSFQ